MLFSGHSHFPLGDPRSISQKVFTSVNAGTSTYSEIEPDIVDEGIHPAGYDDDSQSYYRIDYAGNATLKNAFMNAFTFETVYSPDNLSNMCVMSGQENGFAGIEQASGGQICIFAFVGGSYKVLKSNVTAKTGETYHVIAVYDAQEGVTRLFINGQPAGEMEAKGTLTFPRDEDAHWTAVGGDSSTGNFTQYCLKGTVSRARIYGKALNRDEAFLLYLENGIPSTDNHNQ